MSVKYVVLSLGVMLAISFGANAEQSKNDHQKMMINNITKMELLLSGMENQKDGWELRSSMIKHAKLMEDSAALMESMEGVEALSSERCEGDNKLEPSASETCDKPGSHADVQQRMMLVLIQHLLIRQNIILRNIGILPK